WPLRALSTGEAQARALRRASRWASIVLPFLGFSELPEKSPLVRAGALAALSLGLVSTAFLMASETFFANPSSLGSRPLIELRKVRLSVRASGSAPYLPALR